MARGGISGFMRFSGYLPFTIAFSLLAGAAQAAGLSIGVVAPTTGNFALLGKQIFDGAAAKIAADGNTAVPIAENCEPDSGAAVAKQIVDAKVAAAVGFLCSETLEGALPALKEAQIPVVTVSVRATILMEDALKAGWPLYRLAPADGSEARRIIDFILSDWASQPMALIEDGTIHGRELTEAIRNALEEKGLKPVFTDTYRPGQEQQVALVRRLEKAGATQVFIGGDRADAAVIARDAAQENIKLSLLGGDALDAANQPVPLKDGVRAVVLPDHAADPGNAELVKSFRASGVEPEGYVLPAYAAAGIVGEAASIAANENKPIIEALQMRAFETVLGPIRFTDAHELTENPYQVLEWRGNAFATPATPTE